MRVHCDALRDINMFQNKLIASVVVLFLAHVAGAQDAYFNLPLGSLKLTEGTLPKATATDQRHLHWQRAPALQPYVVIDGEGEAYVEGAHVEPSDMSGRNFQNAFLTMRAPKGKTITGQLFFPKPDLSGMVALRFTVPPSDAHGDGDAEARNLFLQVKQDHYGELLGRGVPGTAWFRHQQQIISSARGTPAGELAPARLGVNAREFGFDETFELFSGGRALSENLQLDRALPVGRTNGEALVDITNLLGITVREMDWKPLIKNLKPELDPLAAYVPHDQHAVFFPTFAAMNEMLAEAEANGTPLLQWLEPRSEDSDTRGRYQKQLCLELNEVSRLLGPQVIRSMAFTGSDPYLRTGSDVGILFETISPTLLKTFLAARHASMQQSNAAVKAVKGEIDGVAYSGVVTPDRSVSSYMATVNEVVFISNSPYQLGRLIKTAKKQQPALAAQDEYIFFRNRYARTNHEETALIVLTDATIRRWCGPQWRIANSRRTRAAAALSEAQAAHLEELVSGKVKPGNAVVAASSAELGDIRVTRNGVISSIWGTLDFLTPIAEVPLAKVTQTEASAYERWQESYQQNWRQFFDPIAIRVSANPRQISAEVTVMPLIANTEYRNYISLTRDSSIAPDGGDRHAEALAHFTMSINSKSELLKPAGELLGTVNSTLRANPLGWLGESISLYADKDPFWEDLIQSGSGMGYGGSNYHRLPVALHCEVKSAIGVTVFLGALRAYLEQTAPKMTVWENAEHNGQAYMRISSAEAPGQGEFSKLAIYYAVTPKSLVLTLNEALLKRALDRQAARAKSADFVSASKPWLGTNLCLQVDPQFLRALEALSEEKYQNAQQLLSWNNLPILNEWKRLFPSRDPVQLHEQFWQTKLICPGGGSYVWNAKWQTMESTAYGHPGEPKAGPKNNFPLARFNGANLGLNFEQQGLSAKVALDRKAH
jgi:hypothetical protein